VTVHDNAINEDKLRLLIEGCSSVELQVINNCRALDLQPDQISCLKEYLDSIHRPSGFSFRW